MKLLHLFLALFTATFFLGCSSKSQSLQVETNITTSSHERVDLQASGAEAYNWRQLSGTSVILINANSATPSFIAPSVSIKEILVFELEAVTAQIQKKNITLKKQVSVTVHPKAVTVDSTDTGSAVQEMESEQPEQDAKAGVTDVSPTQTHEVNNTDMDSTSGEVESEEPEESTDTGSTVQEMEAAPLKSLKLTLEKNSLNIETNTTLQVIATYDNNTSKDVTNEVAWNLSDTSAVQITQKSLHAKKETNIFIQAKLGAITSNTLALEIYKEINGHRLPPEPDPIINNATLLGIDSNNNGVRDDVERWIYEEYKEKHPIHIDIAMQAGRAYKKVLETPERALEIHDEVGAPLDCDAYYSIYAKYFNEPILLQVDVVTRYFRHKIYFNTQERMDAYLQYDKLLSGGVYTLPEMNELKSKCDFNTSKYEE